LAVLRSPSASSSTTRPVTIENINWHLEQGKDVVNAILDGAQQIVTPAFVSLLSICIVFVPMFFLGGVARYLFVPMAEAVVFSLIASFVLSRTLVPTMAKYLLRPHVDPHPATPNPAVDAMREDATQHMSSGISLPARFQRAFERVFEDARDVYRSLLTLALQHRRSFVLGFLGFVAASFLLAPWLGSNFFPSIDAGQIKLHMRAPTGHAHRGDGTARYRSRKGDPQGHSYGGTQERGRQHRPAGQRHQHHLQQLRADRSGRCRYPDFAERRT
jgi:multidrug efflux pump subunit AcrB